jgi:steroid Delta-isomerase
MDVEAWLALFEPDATGHDPGIPLLVGHDGLRSFFDGLLAHFTAFSTTPGEIFLCDRGAAAQWSMRATTKAGREVAFSGIEVFEVSAGGKIQGVRAYWDSAELAAQLQG